MNVLIIEDELPAARRLERLLRELEPDISVWAQISSVEETLDYLATLPVPPDLIFSDIQLSDGLSFDIFRQIPPPCPIVFVTAFDEYAIEAFKTHSVDYLLKPIDKTALEQALYKFRQYFAAKTQNVPAQTPSDLIRLLQQLSPTTPKTYRKRFLVLRGETYLTIDVQDIAYLYSENRITRIMRTDGKVFPIDLTLDEVEQELDPTDFFRLSRQYIARMSSIQQVAKYFNGKLKIDLSPKPPEEVTVSRDKAEQFRRWLDA